MGKPISILLADDHEMVRAMLARWLDAESDLEVVASVDNADDAISEAARLRPAIILMDIDMPGRHCFDAARTIKEQWPDTRIIFLSAFSNDRFIEDALAVQASGYVTKDEPPETVIHAIRQAVSGAAYFSPKVQARIVVDPRGARLAQEKKSRVSTLTRREMEVLRYVARGLSKKEIAGTMHVGVKTVEHHANSLMGKLDIHDRVELARFAIREGVAEA